MGGVHKTVIGQFNDDGSPAPKPVAVEAPVSESDNDPTIGDVVNEDLSALTVQELRVRGDIAGIAFDGKPRKAEIIEALEAAESAEDGGDGYSIITDTPTDYGSTSEGYTG